MYNEKNNSYTNKKQQFHAPYEKKEEKQSAQTFFGELTHNKNWIKIGADKDLVIYAEKAGRFMAKNDLTTSKIRSIYGEIKRIQMGDFEKEKSAFYLLKPKVAYAQGREKNIEGLNLFKMIFDLFSEDVHDCQTFKNFSLLMEAILAYHKAYVEHDR